jgi:hypothetical protein
MAYREGQVMGQIIEAENFQSQGTAWIGFKNFSGVKLISVSTNHPT